MAQIFLLAFSQHLPSFLRCAQSSAFRTRSINTVSSIYGCLEIYYRIDALVTSMRISQKIAEHHKQKAAELSERFRAIELEGDAYRNPKTILRIQDEVDQAIPIDQLWLPKE